MTIAQSLLSFALVAGLLTIIPGLDTALVLRASISKGRNYAFATAVGVNSGALLWGIAAAVGASALLAASEVGYRLLTVAGAAYMVVLGASMLWRSFRKPRVDLSVELVERRSSWWHGWLIGTSTNLLNPKVGVFYLATIPLFLSPEAPPLLMGVLLALVHCVLGFVWFAAIILGTGMARRWLKSPRVARIVDRMTGGVLVGFGVTLALQRS